MKHCAISNRRARALLRLKAFRRSEDGSMVFFGLIIILMIALLGGIGVDTMNAEMRRTELQDTLDRAVLAAASLDQELPAEDVVRDYFDKTALSEHLGDIEVEQGIGYKSVSASAEATIATRFMNLAGVDALTLKAASAATESIGGVEISLVLDVSGSMNSNSRLPNLKVAAKDFVTTLTNTTQDGNLSVSIVPYATQVSIPDELATHLNIEDLTTAETNSDSDNYANCVNFQAEDFGQTNIDHDTTMQRTLLFDSWYDFDGRSYDPKEYVGSLGNGISPCLPNDGSSRTASREVQVLQKNELSLHNFIDSMYGQGNTSLDIGMKWGVALLDPSMQEVVSDMITEGDVPADFTERPTAYDSGDTLKVVVLMTDGQNTSQPYIEDGYRSGASNVFWNDDAERYSIYIGEDYGDEDNDGNTDEPMYYWPDTWELGSGVSQWQDHPYGGLEGDTEESSYDSTVATTSYVCRSYRWNGSCRRYRRVTTYETTSNSEVGDSVALTYPELWAYTTLESNVEDHYEPWMNDSQAWDDWYYDVTSYHGNSTKNTRTLNICQAAKDAGIIVFTIGFEAPTDGQAVLESCASSAAHYYDVDGLEISDAFASIASSIRQLRLVQ